MIKPLRLHPKIRKGYGWHQPKWPTHRFSLYMTHIDASAFPTSVDLRPDCPPVYDQGALGSCTANAWGGLAEFLSIKLKLPDFTPSRLFIYYQERLLDGDVVEDAGAALADGAHVTSTSGCPHEDIWPYNIRQFSTKPPDIVYADGINHLLLDPQQVHQDLNSMKSILVNGQPIAIGFSVFESFESDAVAASGIVPMPGKQEQLMGGHAVLVVGYNDVTSTFIVRNSWGKSWGQDGYFEMPYAYLINPRLANDFWTADHVK